MKKIIIVIYFGLLCSWVYPGGFGSNSCNFRVNSAGAAIIPIEGNVKSVKSDGILVENVVVDEKYLAEKARQEYLKGSFANKRITENNIKRMNGDKPSETIPPITVFIFIDPNGYYDGQKVSIKAMDCGTWTNPSSEETFRAFKKAGK